MVLLGELLQLVSGEGYGMLGIGVTRKSYRLGLLFGQLVLGVLQFLIDRGMGYQLLLPVRVGFHVGQFGKPDDFVALTGILKISVLQMFDLIEDVNWSVRLHSLQYDSIVRFSVRFLLHDCTVFFQYTAHYLQIDHRHENKQVVSYGLLVQTVLVLFVLYQVGYGSLAGKRRRNSARAALIVEVDVERTEESGEYEIDSNVHNEFEVEGIEETDMCKLLNLAQQRQGLWNIGCIAAFAVLQPFLVLGYFAETCPVFDLLELVVGEQLLMMHLSTQLVQTRYQNYQL